MAAKLVVKLKGFDRKTGVLVGTCPWFNFIAALTLRTDTPKIEGSSYIYYLKLIDWWNGSVPFLFRNGVLEKGEGDCVEASVVSMEIIKHIERVVKKKEEVPCQNTVIQRN